MGPSLSLRKLYLRQLVAFFIDMRDVGPSPRLMERLLNMYQCSFATEDISFSAYRHCSHAVSDQSGNF